MMRFQAFSRKYDGITEQIISTCEASDLIKDVSQELNMTTFCALWDTGASCSSISKDAAEKLGLAPVSSATVCHANGTATVNIYDISLALPNNVLLPFVRVVEGRYTGFDLLIGMDIITQGDFSISNMNGKTTFSFRMPSCKETDFMAEIDDLVE